LSGPNKASREGKVYEMKIHRRKGKSVMFDLSVSESPEFLHLVNRIAFQELGSRDTCVLTSHALTNVLHQLGFVAFPLRVEAAVFFDDRKLIGCSLGTISPDYRSKTERGSWKGHLAVVVCEGADEWLLDPTLDQSNKPEWPASARVSPIAFRLQDHFWEGKLMFFRMGDALVRYKMHPRQIGFTSAPDARPSHWRPLAEEILAALAIRPPSFTEMLKMQTNPRHT
jgi:hypothetical protein